jgi:hypothetical protein
MHYPNQKNANLDLLGIILHHIELSVLDVVIMNELNSDHNLVLFTAKCSIEAEESYGPQHPMGYFQATAEVDRISFGPFSVHQPIGDRITNSLRPARITGQANRVTLCL